MELEIYRFTDWSRGIEYWSSGEHRLGQVVASTPDGDARWLAPYLWIGDKLVSDHFWTIQGVGRYLRSHYEDFEAYVVDAD